MFMYVVLILLACLLVLATGAALYIGVFKASRPDIGLGRKILSGLASGMVATVIWFFFYSHQYLGW